jgi:hypothetical protein
MLHRPAHHSFSVDAVQGREVDVVVLSCVRSERSLGFLADWRRVNVGLSRAREQLIVIGAPRTLHLDSYWSRALKGMRRFPHYNAFADAYLTSVPPQWALKCQRPPPPPPAIVQMEGGGAKGASAGKRDGKVPKPSTKRRNHKKGQT